MTNLPVSGIFSVTATYGQAGRYWKNGHSGIDITCGKREIYATCDGVVRVVSYDSAGWGYYISIGDSSKSREFVMTRQFDGLYIQSCLYNATMYRVILSPQSLEMWYEQM